MKLQKRSFAWSLISLFIVLAGSALAAGEQTVALNADKAGKGAKGEVAITDGKAGQEQVTITMSGLRPDSVYTVWLVNMKPKMDMAGMGTGDYSFGSDRKGTGKYSAMISSADLAKWQMVEIAYHPGGDAKDMKTMQIALSAPIQNRKK